MSAVQIHFLDVTKVESLFIQFVTEQFVILQQHQVKYYFSVETFKRIISIWHIYPPIEHFFPHFIARDLFETCSDF